MHTRNVCVRLLPSNSKFWNSCLPVMLDVQVRCSKEFLRSIFCKFSPCFIFYKLHTKVQPDNRHEGPHHLKGSYLVYFFKGRHTRYKEYLYLDEYFQACNNNLTDTKIKETLEFSVQGLVIGINSGFSLFFLFKIKSFSMHTIGTKF